MNKHVQIASETFSERALLALGIEDVAYIRPTEVEGQQAFAVCTADGNEIATFDDRDVAFAACRQHDLEPVSVH